ncbi:mediator of RNA polymerase II transcription subunit 1-like [Actinia tenebrosa]|uniref:Mediator of RNA polymerase II transcription subunit 1 n=1 Tax=Actinia tenebrosa TaxID=6105 RepID=A0A6P8IIL1_ACTTE|nr:mediator of RNA polymerase II transcription subunit 1-like [Actinia tenebrosa]
MAVEVETCGSCCLKLKDLIKGYESELGLTGNNADGTKIHIFGNVNFCLEHNKFSELLNSIRSKCQQCKSWTDSKKAIRASLERQQQTENLAPVKGFIKECLDKLQHAMKDNSIKGVVQRLEAITRKVGLKFYDNGTGTDCFISSDMFYVEVKMETNGKVSEVKVAHAGDPESCPELTRVLREGDYEEFACHLKGLSDLYELSGDTFQKSKILMALKALEIDINMILSLYGSNENSTDTILKCPVGFGTPRQGGRLMRLTYFATPYELLDVKNPGENLKFTKDNHPPLDLGCWVSLSVEQSQMCHLPTKPLIEEPMMECMIDDIVKYQPLDDNNSDELPASFVLRLNKPMVMSVQCAQKICSVIHQGGNFVHSSKISVEKLLIREWWKSQGITSEEQPVTYYADLPGHYHVYYNTESDFTDEFVGDNAGVLVYRVPFTHPSHVPDIIKQLRRQASYNSLLTSALRTDKTPPKAKDQTEYTFELSTPAPFTVTITFEHPCTAGMASIDFEVGEDSNVQASLHTVPGQPVFGTNEYLTKVIQRCHSIPAAMRCVIRKAHSVKPEELPVKKTITQGLTPTITTPHSANIDKLTIPGNPFFANPSGPNTPAYFGSTSPTFGFSLETPSPTLSAFPFSISPTLNTFSFVGNEMNSMNSDMISSRLTDKKLETPKPPSTPKLTLVLKRKRDDEYVVKDFQVPEMTIDSLDSSSINTQSEPPKMSYEGLQSPKVLEHPASMEPAPPVLDLGKSRVDGMGSYGVLGPGFGDMSSGSLQSSSSGLNMSSTAISMSTSGLGLAAGMETIPGTELFDMTSGVGPVGSSVADLEGILSSLPGASHLSVDSALEFDAGLGSGSHVMDVDGNFDIDAAIDASASSDPSIAGVVASADAFDVDSALEFDLDHITGPANDLNSGGSDLGDQTLPDSLLSPGDGMVSMDTGMISD